MKRCTVAVVVVLLSASFLQAQSQPNPTNPFTDWARTNAIRLQTVEAGHGFDDMKPLNSVVGDARIVALGEATHGTREFFQLKHRMVEFIAAQKGFTIFCIEANMPEAYRLNDFVLNGVGDPRQLLQGMYFWTWNTQEVLDMILWMRDFNKSGKGHIEFTGFDMQMPDVAGQIVSDFVKKYDAAYLDALNQSYKYVAQAQPQGMRPFGVVTYALPATGLIGKRINYSGFIRTDKITRDYAGLWLRIDGESGMISLDNMQDRGPKGTTSWARYELSMNVPADAKRIVFGVIQPGDGTAWFDSLHLEADGAPIADAEKLDLDFESGTLHSAFTGGAGYDIAIDKTASHTGQHSLRTTLARESPAPTTDLGLVSVACKQVVDHLESHRSAYTESGAAPKQIEWAIQNARVVLQSVQSRTGEKVRDESMADNVSWIAAQNPNAKIVLWAHNGHIAYSSPGYQPMGAYLRKRFGSALVNMGFGFNQGSFRAIETGKGLREFTVGPAPADTMDHALGQVGSPILVLNFRKVPADGPVQNWLKQERRSRSIGAVYSEANAEQFYVAIPAKEMYDVILFVEKTTAARKVDSTAGQ